MHSGSARSTDLERVGRQREHIREEMGECGDGALPRPTRGSGAPVTMRRRQTGEHPGLVIQMAVETNSSRTKSPDWRDEHGN